MDYEMFVQQHRKFTIEDVRPEIDFALGQRAWQNFFGDRNVEDLLHMDREERTLTVSLLDREIERLREVFYSDPRFGIEEPEPQYYFKDMEFRLDDKVEEMRSSLSDRGYGEQEIEDAYRENFDGRKFELSGLRPEVVGHALDEWIKEIDKQAVMDNMIVNLYLRYGNQSLKQSRKERDFGSLESRAYNRLFGDRPFDLNELIPELRDAELSRWEKAVITHSARENVVTGPKDRSAVDERDALERTFGEGDAVTRSFGEGDAVTRSFGEGDNVTGVFGERDAVTRFDYVGFVNQHDELNFDSYEDELQFAIAQHAWDKLQGDRPVSELIWMSEEEREPLLVAMNSEVDRLEKSYLSYDDLQASERADPEKDKYRDELIDEGFEPEVVDDVFKRIFGEREFSLEGMKASAITDAMKEVELVTDCFAVQNKLLLSQYNAMFQSEVDLGHDAEAVFKKVVDSAEGKAFAQVGERFKFLLSDLRQDVLNKELESWRDGVVLEQHRREHGTPVIERDDDFGKILFGEEAHGDLLIGEGMDLFDFRSADEHSPGMVQARSAEELSPGAERDVIGGEHSPGKEQIRERDEEERGRDNGDERGR